MTATSGRKQTRRSFLHALAAFGAGSALPIAGCGDWSSGRSGSRVTSGSPLARLRDSMDGTLILPGDSAYEQSRRVASFNPRSDRRPAIIARCASGPDVARCLDYARSSDLAVAVRSGGHDVLGESVCDGGIVIDVGSMNRIDVLAGRRIARVQAGARAGQVNEALDRHGLAAALGCNPAVGVGGLVLGGGLGWLLGRFGASCDNVRAVDLVMADGRQLRASQESESDLFWAVRGGGGNFGIATAFELEVHPVEKVVGGYLAYRGVHAVQFLRAYREVMARAPDELTLELILRPSAEPPAHEPILIAGACFAGSVRDAERTLAPLRSVGPPLVNLVRETRYARLIDPQPEMASIMGAPPAAGEPRAPSDGRNYWKGASLSSWSDPAIDAFIGCAATAPPGWSMGVGHHMHGQICRVPDRDTPLVRRAGSYSYFFNMDWSGERGSSAAMEWVDRSLAAMKPFSDAATYINYLSDGAASAVVTSYGDNYPRLRELKLRHDPDNVFHLNRNIRPAE